MDLFDQLLLSEIDNIEWLEDESGADEGTPLSILADGDHFFLGEKEFILLEHTANGCSKVIQNDFWDNTMEFGSNADWKESEIRAFLNSEYYNWITEKIGSENIIEMSRDLSSLDGLDDFGFCTDKISLLTANEYAKYHKLLGVNQNYRYWWWTITPFSTPSNGYSRRVCCVCSDGSLRWGVCDRCYGVRPFFVLDSSVLVSRNFESER